MQFDDKDSLSKARIQKAEDCLKDSQALITAGGYTSSANRSYYAVFHAMRAVLALDGFDSKKHSGIIAEFRKDYIKTGIFGSHISEIIGNQFDVRSHSDYDDFYIISREDAVCQAEEAAFLVETIKEFLDKKYNEG